jgi:hypothetical protein
VGEGIELVKLDGDTHQDFDRANWLQRGPVGFRRPQDAVEKETTGKTSKEDGRAGTGTCAHPFRPAPSEDNSSP